MAIYPDTKLIVIDTLERIRDTEFDKNICACDYRDMTLLREITGKHKLTIANRDTEGFCFKLRFETEDCKWAFVGNDGEVLEEKTEERDESLLLIVEEFLKDEWSGTATELCEELKKIDPETKLMYRTITKKLKSNFSYFKENHIIIDFEGRNRDNRVIKLSRQSLVPQVEQAYTDLQSVTL